MPGPQLCYATHQRATSAHCKRGGLPPSLAPLVRHPSTPPRRGRACPARSLASAPGFVLYPLCLLHRREGLRGCEQGPRLSGAKPGCEQCLPLRGKQPHERVCEANWRRSLCAAKRCPLRRFTPNPVNVPPAGKNSSPAVHLPPPRSHPQNSQPLPNPTSEGAGFTDLYTLL